MLGYRLSLCLFAARDDGRPVKRTMSDAAAT
jgi:hypothetical protein